MGTQRSHLLFLVPINITHAMLSMTLETERRSWKKGEFEQPPYSDVQPDSCPNARGSLSSHKRMKRDIRATPTLSGL